MTVPAPSAQSWLTLARTVRFGDTDAAGVMHFHQLLRWCHEAYEESLERFGIEAGAVFPGTAPLAVALPIVHCRADYRRALRTGEPLVIELEPQRLDPGCFEVHYRFHRREELVAQGLTRHQAVTTDGPQRCTLPEPIQRWLEASSLTGQVRPL